MTASIDKVIRDAMARTLWVWAWGNYNGGEGRPVDNSEVGIPFWRWDDEKEMALAGYPDWHAWVTPVGAYEAADSLRTLYMGIQEDAEYGKIGGLDVLLTVAMIADQDSDDLTTENAVYFGQMLAEMAIRMEPSTHKGESGGLRSWFYNHEVFPLAVPQFNSELVRTGRTDSWGFARHDLTWSGSHASSAVGGSLETSIFGDEPRIEIGDAEPIWLGESIDRLASKYHRDHGTIGDVVVDQLFELFQERAQDGGQELITTEKARPGVYVQGETDNVDTRRVEVFGVPNAEIVKANEIVRDTMEANNGSTRGLRHWGRLIYINEGDRTSWKQTFVLWAGMYSSKRYVVYADHLQDAFDELIDYISEYEPAMLVDDQVREEYVRLFAEFTKEHGREPDEEEGYTIMEEAEVDTVSGGNASERINSDDWGIIAEDPSGEQLAAIAKG